MNPQSGFSSRVHSCPWLLSINHPSKYQLINDQPTDEASNKSTNRNKPYHQILLPWYLCQGPALSTNQPFSQRLRLLCRPPLPPLEGSCQAVNQWTINQGSLLGSTPPTSSRLLPSNQPINHQSGFSSSVHPSHLQQAPAKQSINEPSIRVLVWVHSSPLQLDFVNKPSIKQSTYKWSTNQLNQCCRSESGSGSFVSTCFWASWIRIRILAKIVRKTFLLFCDYFLTFDL
jgi:hypothetical protein